MTKTPLFFLLWAVMSISLFAQGSKETNAKISLVSAKTDETVFTVTVTDFQFRNVITPRGNSVSLVLDGASKVLLKGAPEVLKLSTSVIIPDLAEMETEVIASSYKDYPNVDLAPSKGNFTRDQKPSEIPYVYGKQYSTNEFFPGTVAALSSPYILKDYRGQAVNIYPFQYNPVTKVLRVYKQLTIKVKKVSDNGINPFIRNSAHRTNEEFAQVYTHQFLNYQSAKYNAASEQGKMLIICYEPFMSAMQPFVEWKNKSGIATEMVSVTTAGSTYTAIKNYVQNYYTTNGLTYLLLVGDAAQVPTFTVSGGGSDNTYSYLTGNDHYPEIYVGRFSAETIAHVETMVKRSLEYEKNPVTTTNWLNKSISIGSTEGPGDDNEMDWQHQRNMRTDLLAYQYAEGAELYDGNQGGEDANGDPIPGSLSDKVNQGAGIILYTGHGSDDSFVTTGFSVTQVNTLNNVGMLPFIWSVACVNGNFVGQTCFAEAWTRATNANGQPVGAVATLMSTINQSWNPPMDAQDEMVDVLTENIPANIKHTFGGLSMSGCMKMNDTYGTQGDDMTDTWNIFGDPSLMVRTDTPKVMMVTHPNTVVVGAMQMVVNCNSEGARVALSINGQLISTAQVSNGTALLNFSALSAIDTIDVVVTSYNYLPYQGQCQIIVASGPYVLLNSTRINDVLGNNNQKADYNEQFALGLNLKNMGVGLATGVYAKITSSDPYLTIIQDSAYWGNINANDTSFVANAFKLKLANNVPDQHAVNLSLAIKDNAGNTWNSNTSVFANSPSFSIGNWVVKDTVSGNNDGKLDQNETAVLTFSFLNNGHALAPNVKGILLCTNPDISIVSNDTILAGDLAAGNTNSVSFTVGASSSIAVGTNLQFVFRAVSGEFANQKTFNQVIGIVSEDFETGTFTKVPWNLSGNSNWTISTTEKYESIYAAKSGVITDNQISTLEVVMNVLQADTISFYAKVSCENDPYGTNYDYFEFKIDNTSKKKVDGEVAWTRYKYYVTAGSHTFTWNYKKDVQDQGGSDCAWVDYIKFPPGIFGGGNIGIEDITNEGDAKIQCFPNPFNENLTINLQGEINQVSLFDATGKLISTYNTTGQHTLSISGGNLQTGVYYLRYETNNSVKHIKLIHTH